VLTFDITIFGASIQPLRVGLRSEGYDNQTTGAAALLVRRRLR
jgi:hypothetical protein